MRKLLSLIAIMCFAFGMQGQDLISKIPSTAKAVVTLKGKNITNLLSVKEFEDSKIGKLLVRELTNDTKGKITDLKGLALALDKNFYYFMETEKGVFTNSFLIPLTTSDGFMSVIPEHKKEKMITEAGLSYVQDEYDGTVVMWNNNTLLVTFNIDTNYDDYGYYDDIYGYDSNPGLTVQEAEVEVAPAAEAADAAEEVVVEEVEMVVEATEVEEVEETVIESTDTYTDYYNSDAYKKEQAKREQRRKEREAKRAEAKKSQNKEALARAKRIMNGNATRSILKNTAYVQSLGKGTDEAHAWVSDFGSIYKSALPAYMFGANPMGMYDVEKLYGGMSLTSRLNFEKDKATLKTSYQMNDEMSAIYAPMYNGTMNKNFFQYFNEDQMLGYFSVNMSTEGLLTAYPELMDMMFENSSDEEVAMIAPLATRLFSILIDEKGAADLLRGDMLLVLTDLVEREVTYTTYEYDENYNSTPVTKTKQESLPDFLFMFTSKEKDMFNRLMRVAVKQKEVTFENGLYQFKISERTPFDIFVMFKDDAVFMGSSKTHLMAIDRGTYKAKVSSNHKKTISKNATSIYVNGKQIVSQVPSELYPRDLRNKVDFIANNTEDVLFTAGKVKGNTMQGEMILNTPEEGHKNSLVYFINLLNGMID